jgi:NAD(P)-dependent dehydrogenase (short-subunit alcohol dehydrogenase family)
VTAPGYRAALAGLIERRGPIDAAIYCAGVGEPFTVDDVGAQRAAFEVNLLGAVDAFEVLAPAWRAARRGHFVVLSSLADKLVGPHAPAYNASKAAVTSYFESLALAARPHGIAITNVRFGFVDTKLAKSPIRPFLMSRDRAVREVERALARRPIRRSAPWSMDLRTALRRCYAARRSRALSMAMLCAALGLVAQCRVLAG